MVNAVAGSASASPVVEVTSGHFSVDGKGIVKKLCNPKCCVDDRRVTPLVEDREKFIKVRFARCESSKLGNLGDFEISQFD